jgi:putative acyl-CoA dehydrogenase
MTREPESAAAFLAQIEAARGGNALLDRAIEDLKDRLVPARAPETAARRLVEIMALTLQGALLVRHAPAAMADAFCATRLGERPGFAYGALDGKIDADAIIARAMPQL